MHISWKLTAGFSAAVILSGCATPFADRVAYDTAIRNAPGTISLSDPKLFTREALISERARDIKWIDDLIDKSSTVIFRPELVREVEQITAMAAAIGLKFDPATALTYRRGKETDDIQHEIDVMKLKLQIDQLKRDAELVRSQFTSQTAPVNEGLGTLGSNSAQNSNSLTASAVDQLQIAIGNLKTTLTSRLDVDGKLPKDTPVASSPFDHFRQLSSYRDMLKAARNAADLDQLHDYANARLIRLNFQANVVPDSDNPRSIGAIQVHVVEPSKDSAATQQFLRRWLEYINTKAEYRSGANMNKANKEIGELLLSGLFENVTVHGIELLLPVVVDGDNRPQIPSDIYHSSKWDRSLSADTEDYGKITSKLSSIFKTETDEILGRICANDSQAGMPELIEKYIQEAGKRELSIDYIRLAKIVAQATGTSIALNDNDTKFTTASVFRQQALQFMSKDSRCVAYVGAQRSMAKVTWRALMNLATDENNKVRIYEIGPREQVQQVSTVARSASSLALAASIAASNPGSGVGAEAAASYSRQAMGRATALERVPSVVGYSQAGRDTFGWVLGPQAVLNAKGRIDMAQLLKTYDLSVDLSVPGWWPIFDLQVTTAWAPSPQRIAVGELDGSGDKSNTMTVPLVRNSADEFDSLTQYMLGLQDQSVVIKSVLGGPINACAKSTLLITGNNIWRAKQVFVLGQALGAEAITVTPDMKGILLSVPIITPLPKGKIDGTLSVITPLGRNVPMPISKLYIPEPSGDGCKPDKAPTTDADAVSISDIKPLEMVVPSKFEFKVTGTNLSKIDRVALHSQDGSVEIADHGKSLTVEFDETLTSSIPASDNIELAFFEKGKATPTITKHVRVQRK